MIRERIFIEKPISEVWDYVVLELAKSFKCSPSQLKGKEVKSTTQNFGSSVEITQTVTELEPQEYVEIVSESSKTRAVKIYEFEADEDGTYLVTGEKGEGINSIFRTWNFRLLELPVLRNSTKKKLRFSLEYIKASLEGTLELEELQDEGDEA